MSARIRDLDFPYPLVAFGGAGHWRQVDLTAHQPLTGSGIRSFVRYEDALGTRFAFLASRWAADGPGGPTATALVYAVDENGEARPPRAHPSHDARFAQVAEVELGTSPDMLRPAEPPVPTAELTWARHPQGGLLVPVELYDSPNGYSQVTVLAAGPLPPGVFLSRAGVAGDVSTAAAPIAVDLYGFTARNVERAGRRAAAGRGRPVARALVGTLGLFEGGRP